MIKNSNLADADEVIALQKYALISAGQNFINAMKVASPNTDYTFIKGRNFICNQGSDDFVITNVTPPTFTADNSYNDDFCLQNVNINLARDVSRGTTYSGNVNLGCNRQISIFACPAASSNYTSFYGFVKSTEGFLHVAIKSGSNSCSNCAYHIGCVASCNRASADYYLLCTSLYLCSKCVSYCQCARGCVQLGSFCFLGGEAIACGVDCCVEMAKYEFCKIAGTPCYCFFKDDSYICTVNPNFGTFKGFVFCGWAYGAYNCTLENYEASSEICATCWIECFCSPYYLTCSLSEESHDIISLSTSGDSDNILCYELVDSNGNCISSLEKNNLNLLPSPVSCYSLKIYNPILCCNCNNESDDVNLDGYALIGMSRSPTL